MISPQENHPQRALSVCLDLCRGAFARRRRFLANETNRKGVLLMNPRQAGGFSCFVALASIAALGTPSLALAADERFYVGFDLGVSRFSKDEVITVSPDLVLSTSGSSLDNDDVAWALIAGYRI